MREEAMPVPSHFRLTTPLLLCILLTKRLVSKCEGLAVPKTKTRDAAYSRAAILNVAESLFAQKGFDGTRVDEIAAGAGVNKALIYYYFKGKNAILDALFTEAMRDIMSVFAQVYDDLEIDDNEIERIFELMVTTVLRKKQILRVMYMESLKTSVKRPCLFTIADYLMSSEVDTIIKLFREKNFPIPDAFSRNQMLVAEFFTGFIPLINYVVFADQWMQHYQVAADELKRLFFNAFKMTHFSYHQQMIGK